MRDLSHSDLVEFARRAAIERDRLSQMRANYRNVEKADHFRQLAAITLFAVNVLAWGSVVYQYLHT